MDWRNPNKRGGYRGGASSNSGHHSAANAASPKATAESKASQELQELEVQYKHAVSQLQHFQQLLETQMDRNRRGVVRLKETDEKAEAQLAKRPATVSFNAGGTIFKINKTSIAPHTRSLFYCILATEFWEPGADGAYFFDRDPDYFKYTFDFLRYGEKIYPEHLDEELLDAEYDYFFPPPPPATSTNVTKAKKQQLYEKESDQQLHLKLEQFEEDVLQFVVKSRESDLAPVQQSLEAWDTLVGRVRDAQKIAAGRVTFDVGGQVFATSRTSVAKSDYLSSAVERWNPEKDGIYFIDQSATYFAYVMKYLRSGSLGDVPSEFETPINTLVDYLGIKTQPQFRFQQTFNGELMEKTLRYEWGDKVDDQTGVDRELQTLIVLKSSGSSGYAHLAQYDDAKPSVIGGYAPGSWNLHSLWSNQPEAFLFCQREGADLKISKIQAHAGQNAMYSAPTDFFRFGAGHDIYVQSNGVLATASMNPSSFPPLFNNRAGSPLNIVEIEVFAKK